MAEEKKAEQPKWQRVVVHVTDAVEITFDLPTDIEPPKPPNFISPLRRAENLMIRQRMGDPQVERSLTFREHMKLVHAEEERANLRHIADGCSAAANRIGNRAYEELGMKFLDTVVGPPAESRDPDDSDRRCCMQYPAKGEFFGIDNARFNAMCSQRTPESMKDIEEQLRIWEEKIEVLEGDAEYEEVRAAVWRHGVLTGLKMTRMGFST